MIGQPGDTEAYEALHGTLLLEWSQQPSRLHQKKVKALEILRTEPRIADESLMQNWKYRILILKLEQLQSAGTVAEVDEILLQAKKDGKYFRIPTHSRFWLVEEEALFWMERSLDAPLSSDGFDRYKDVFKRLCEKYQMQERYESVFAR